MILHLANLYTQQLIASLAQTHRNELVVCWDNFDYNQGVRHQTLDELSKHVSATTGKLCICRGIPAGGLQRSMLHLDVKLTSPIFRTQMVTEKMKYFTIVKLLDC